MNGSAFLLDRACRDAGLSPRALWERCFALGGMSTPLELDAYLHRALIPAAHEHDVIAQALNERFRELGRQPSVPYATDATLDAPGPATRP